MIITIPLGLALGSQRLREVHMKSLSRGVYLSILPLLSITVGTACAEPQFLLAQAPIQIPSDAELERMERQGIVTPPLMMVEARLTAALLPRTVRWTSRPTALTKSCSAAAFAATVEDRRTAAQLSAVNLRPDRETPALANPTIGTIRSATHGCKACSSMCSGEAGSSGRPSEGRSGIVRVSATPARVA